jgi:hypothetical protein
MLRYALTLKTLCIQARALRIVSFYQQIILESLLCQIHIFTSLQKQIKTSFTAIFREACNAAQQSDEKREKMQALSRAIV